MLDRYGRKIDYLRISVTPYCNLRCIYCAPEIPAQAGPAAVTDCRSFLSAAEIGAVTAVMAEQGINKVRITGGEPLVRPDLPEIIANVAGMQGIADLAMTTNGIGLAEKAGQLKGAGLMRVNISIDSLDNDKFAYITGGGNLARVLQGIKAAVKVGLVPVKLNVVVMKGINDDEIDRFIELTREEPVDVRFIELMPIGKFGEDNASRLISSDEIIAARPRLAEEPGATVATAQYYALPGYRGRVGFISPMSHQFCGRCNRIRLTADGKIKACLGDNREFDIAAVLRNEPEKLAWSVKKAIARKSAGHHFSAGFVSKRNMTAIGG